MASHLLRAIAKTDVCLDGFFKTFSNDQLPCCSFDSLNFNPSWHAGLCHRHHLKALLQASIFH